MEAFVSSSQSTWSASEYEILEILGDLLGANREAVLATVVAVEGSAYRRPGAKMIFTSEGASAGTITAGCLETEVADLASTVLANGQPCIKRYDLMDDDDIWGLGIGCNGVVDVLLEPIGATHRPMIEAMRNGDNVAALVVLSGPNGDQAIGERIYVDMDEGFDAPSESVFNGVATSLADPVADVLERGRATTLNVETVHGPADVFVDGLRTPPSLVIFGAGNDVRPVVTLAKENGFRVTVIGFRGMNATEARFPEADAVRSTSPSDIRELLTFDENTYTVIMTHNLLDDRLVLEELLKTPVPYIGLLGPQKRFDELLDDFESEVPQIGSNDLERIYTPIGIDLGGGSPSQIALSIVAEVLAVSNDRSPAHLSERTGPIHERLSTGGTDLQ